MARRRPSLRPATPSGDQGTRTGGDPRRYCPRTRVQRNKGLTPSRDSPNARLPANQEAAARHAAFGLGQFAGGDRNQANVRQPGQDRVRADKGLGHNGRIA